ncbi:Peptidase S8/S53 domain superfamily [Sesbania bispinosa]|nr:Peptidase S8/S53 domain superfamily [Sesbania bispinosa]
MGIIMGFKNSENDLGITMGISSWASITPILASFSARGPNGLDPEIMKPDLITPGVNILAVCVTRIDQENTLIKDYFH